MLSKGSVAILPLVLLLVVWWQKRRIDAGGCGANGAVFLGRRRSNRGKCLVSNARRRLGGPRCELQLSGCWGPARAIWFYLSKALAPVDLIFIYPQWNVQTDDIWWWLPLLAASVVTLRLLSVAAQIAGSQTRARATVVRLGVFLRGAGSHHGIHRRGIHALFAGGRSLSIHRTHRRSGRGGGNASNPWRRPLQSWLPGCWHS